MCGFNYDVFFHVWVPKRKILINMPIDAIPNLDNKDLRASNDGVDIEIRIDESSKWSQRLSPTL